MRRADDQGFSLQFQRRDKEGGQHGEIGQAAAVLQAGDLLAPVAHGAAQLVLGEAGALAEKFQRSAKGLVGQRWSQRVGHR